MLRAELGAGNPDAANRLLERIRERCVIWSTFVSSTMLTFLFFEIRGYPEAVYARISGIMVDNSVFY